MTLRSNWPRRAAVVFGAAILAVGLTTFWTPMQAQAQGKYPERPVRIIVPFGPGGLADVSMRLVAEKLAARLGQQFVIENKPGAGGIAAASEIQKSAPDGHTLIVISNGTAISEALFAKLPYSTKTDMAAISTVAWFDLVFLVNPSSPYKTLKDFLAAARTNPGKFNLGTINPGSTQNLSAELFKSVAKVDVTLVPFRTTPDVLVGLLRNDIALAIDAYTALKGPIDGKEVRPLAVTGATRNAAMPDVPTMKEAGVDGYEVAGWNALYTKAGTPPAIIDLLNKEIVAVTKMPDIQAKFAGLGIVAGAVTPKQMADRMAADVAKWSDVIAKAGIKKL